MLRAIVALLLFLVSTMAHADKRVALVVGIDKYDNLAANAQLQRARSDAAAVAGVLRELRFDVITKDDLTRPAFNSHWQDFLNKLAPGDTAAFYFAGHGVEFGGRTYLLPRDVPNLKPGRDELLRREALSLQEFLADLREKGTRLNLVILDACRDNPFEQMAGRSVGSTRGLVAAEPPEGTFIMYSAGTGESALDRLNEADRDANSVYTRHLLPLLKAPGLTLTDVAEQVRVAVRHVAATVQHRQTPAYYNQVLGRVCIAGGDCSPRLAAPPPTPTYSAAADAARVCREVEGMSNLSMLGVLANQHKGTPAGDCIATRLDELKRQQVAATEKAKREEAEQQQRVAMLKAQEDAKRERPKALVQPDTRKRVALVIGNSAYNKVPKLPSPTRDAAAVETLLRAAGFDTVVRANDLGVAAMRRALRDFSDKTHNADIAVVFYAGHGMEVGGVNYLIPTDAVLERDIDVEDETVSLDRVTQILEPAKTLRLVILDACRDNPFVVSMRRTVAGRSIGRGLGRLEVLTADTLIAFAAKAGSTAADGDGANTPYTTALVKHLTTPGLDLRLALGRVRDEVLKSTGNRQEPFVYGSLGGAQISLVAAP